MISKVITGKSFPGVCRYICSDQKRAVVLEAEGVRGHNYKLMTSDFESQHALRPTLTKAVFHGILSFYPGEKITDSRMVEISKEYLEKMGITETQFAITKHLDKNHPHVHIIANLINNKGEVIKDNWIGLKGKKVAQQLTAKYGLKEALNKNLALTHVERLNERVANRYIIYQAISSILSNCKNLDDLKEQLKKVDIETLYKYKGQTEELQGISFRIGDFKYKGSEIDRQFSVKQLQRILHEQKCMQVIQQPRLNLNESRFRNQLHKQEDRSEHANALNDLLKSERHHEHPPHQWKIKKQKKRKPNRLH